MPIKRPGSLSASAIFSISIEEVLVASTAPGFNLRFDGLEQSLLALELLDDGLDHHVGAGDIETLGVGDQPHHGRLALRPGLKFAREQFLLCLAALFDLLLVQILQ